MWVFDSETLKFLAVNAAAVRHYGYSREEFLAMTLKNIHLYRDGSFLLQYQPALIPSLSKPSLARHRKKDGTLIEVEVFLERIPWGCSTASLILANDITERKEAESLLAGEKRVLEMIASGGGLYDVLDCLCQVIEEQSRGMLCSILLIDPNGPRSRDGSVPSLASNSVRATDDDLQIGPRVGPRSEATHAGKHVIFPDTNPRWADYHNVVRQGLGAWWSTPILSAQKDLLGTFAIHYPESAGPSVHDLQLIERASHMSGIAIERERGEKALRASEEGYRLLFDQNLAGVSVSTVDGQMLDCNQAYAQILGYPSREEVLSHKAWEPYWNPADHGRVLPFLKDRGGFSNIEMRVRRKDGSAVWVLSNINLIRGYEAAPEMIQATLIDITERKQAEEALRRSEERFSKIFHACPAAIGMGSIEGRLIDVNERYLEFFGYHRDEMIGRNVTELRLWANPDDRKEVFAMLQEEGSVRNFEGSFRRKSGEVRNALLSLEILQLTGEPLAIAMLTDITERKRADDALRLLSGRLLRLQDEERRRIARELHDSTAQSLATLVMNLSRLEKSLHALEPRIRNMASDSLALAEQSLREIRTLSYLLHPPLLDERGFASAVRWYVDGFSQRSKIRVYLDLPPELERLPREVETALFRVVQESLTNINRHSESPIARVRLVPGPTELTLEVSDEGRGIPLAALSGLAGTMAGLGVGITGMSERVAQLGGRLEINSTSRGTTVRAILPLARKGT
jgi:PAS domain S-box-containing protein